MPEPKKEKAFPWIIAGTLLLMFAAFYNGFPMMTSDSGGYINIGFRGIVPIDRPMFYGLFVRHSSLASSLWFTVLFQSLMLFYVLWQTLNRFASGLYGNAGKFILLVVLTAFSSISWFAGQIMPDIFVGMGLLAFLLLILTKGNTISTVLNSLILLASCLVHNSCMLGFLIIFVISLLYAIYSKAFSAKIILLKRFILAGCIILSSWIITPLLNYSYGQPFEITGSPYVFLMGKNIENGIVDRYLDENCDKYLQKPVGDTSQYFIFMKHSKKVLDVYGNEPGSPFLQWNFIGIPSQRYRVADAGNNWFRIIPQQSQLCMQAQYDSARQVTTLVQAAQNGSEEQLFRFVPTNEGDHAFYIINKKDHQFAGLSATNENDGTTFDLCDSAGTDDQRFIFVKGRNCLCVFKDELPDHAYAFVWSETGAFSKTGSWAQNTPEYKQTLNNIFFSADYLGANLGAALVATGSQLSRNDIGDGVFVWDNNSSPYRAVQQYFPYELRQFATSAQNRGTIDFPEINKRHFWLLLVSVLTVLVFMLYRPLREKIDPHFVLFIKISLTFILLNAFITGALANVLDRLQCRIIWMLPLIALLLVFNSIAAGRIKK